MKPEDQITSLGLILPPPPPAGGIYKPVVITGKLLFISGQGPVQADGSLIKGVVGDNLTTEEGKNAARQSGLTMLATLQREIGDLNKIKRLIKTLGMVNCTPDFIDQPAVINGYSELMVEVFGEYNGIGARSAVGMMLPGGMATEIEAIFEIHYQ
jgi:enamine deaminase RidA (YjgF/YER057c/UK114 family)